MVVRPSKKWLGHSCTKFRLRFSILESEDAAVFVGPTVLLAGYDEENRV